jgi:serine/threonine-protein kinase
MGTATYFSPEQAQGRPIDFRSDVYALGIVLYEMVVGRPPFYNENPVAVAYQHVRERPVPPRQHNPRIPVAFESVVLKALAKNPVNRYASAEELRADLLRFRSGRPVTARVPPAAVAAGADATTAMAAADSTQVVPMTGATAGGGPRRRTGAYVTLLVVLLALLGGGLFLLAHELGLGSGTADVSVPAVLNRPQDEATSILRAAGFKVKTVPRDSDQAAGTVVDQAPKPDAKAGKGDTVTLGISKGPPQVALPLVVGKDVNTATADLEQLGLTVLTRAQQSDKPQNEVLDQNPKAGTNVAKNSTVTLTISSGTGQATVPNVVGQDSTAAANTLGVAGFKSSAKSQASDTVPAGQVISTSPPAGAKATKGSTVTMVVSTGPSPTTTEPSTTTSNGNAATVPNLSGLNQTQAENQLANRGFVGNCTATGVPGGNGRVVSQSPSSGSQAQVGSTVTYKINATSCA